MKNWPWKNLLVAMTALLLVSGIFKAAQADFWLREKAFLDDLHIKLDKMGAAEKQALLNSCPTPEISMISSKCLEEGETAEVTVNGKFAPGTKFFLETDSISFPYADLISNCGAKSVDVKINLGTWASRISRCVTSPRSTR